MFGAMTSLTGGGGLQSSSASEANSDNQFSFDNTKYYKASGNGNGTPDNKMLYVGLAVVALYFVMKKK